MIVVKGKKDGRKLTVKYNGKKFFFNNKKDDLLLTELRFFLKRKPTIFGTYHAEDPYEKLNIIGVLREYFFDNMNVEIETDEEIEENWESGVVY